MNNQQMLEAPLAEIVRSNFKTTKVMERYGLDFCCKGKRTLAQACTEKGIPAKDVIDDLQSLLYTDEKRHSLDDMSLAHLADHIVDTHHKYVRDQTPLINKYLNKVNNKHTDGFPYMVQVADAFSRLSAELDTHMIKEEQVVFPAIRQLETDSTVHPKFLNLALEMMEDEHELAGSLLQEMRKAANNYEVPEKACTTFAVLLHLLAEFESDLHKHVYLENHILFKKARPLAVNTDAANYN